MCIRKNYFWLPDTKDMKIEKLIIKFLMEVPNLLAPRFQTSSCLINSVTSKKSPNVCKSCLNLISLEKWEILTPLQKLPKNVVVDLGKIIVATGFEKLPKVQWIAQSGHIAHKLFPHQNVRFQGPAPPGVTC